jgi:hypothetical protein
MLPVLIVGQSREKKAPWRHDTAAQKKSDFKVEHLGEFESKLLLPVDHGPR